MEMPQAENVTSTTSEINSNQPSESSSPNVPTKESSPPNSTAEVNKVVVNEINKTNNEPLKNEVKITEAPKKIISEPKNEARNKRLDRSRKKNEKNHELFLKSIQPLPLQDQIDTLIKKMSDMMEENHTLATSTKFYKSQTIILEKEKEQIRAEQNKTLMARTRLENVCRELQNNYKQIKEETATKIREEEEKRKEVTTKFQTTLADVSKMMEQNSSENIKLRNDNIQISDRFKKLCEEFKAREEDVQRIGKQLGLEKKLSEANLARLQLELEAERCEKEVWLKEKEAILRKLHETTKDKLHMEISMKNLEDNLAKYSDKYQKFESTITKSNEIFEIYKGELASMSNQVSKLETDCLTWKERWVQTSQAVNRLIGVNQSLENDLMLSDKKLDQLASLCRFLQNERNCYLKQLKENNIKPEVTNPPDEKATTEQTDQAKLITVNNKEPPARSHPMTAKERELQALRNEIVKLQAEINKAVEKEMEEKLKSKQQEAEKSKRRAKNKKTKKNNKLEENKSKSEQKSPQQSNSPVTVQQSEKSNSPAIEEESDKPSLVTEEHSDASNSPVATAQSENSTSPVTEKSDSLVPELSEKSNNPVTEQSEKSTSPAIDLSEKSDSPAKDQSDKSSICVTDQPVRLQTDTDDQNNKIEEIQPVSNIKEETIDANLSESNQEKLVNNGVVPNNQTQIIEKKETNVEGAKIQSSPVKGTKVKVEKKTESNDTGASNESETDKISNDNNHSQLISKS